MTGPTVSQEQLRRSTERRGQILTAAARLFRQRGFAGVGIDDIGTAVGVSGPAVYRYFPSKHALLAAIVSGYLRSVIDEGGLRGDAESHERGDRFLHSAITVGLRDPDSLVVYLRQLAHLDPADLAAVRADRERVALAWDSVLRAHHIDKTLPSKQLRLRSAAGVLIHVALTRVSGAQARQRLAEQMITVVLDASLPESAAEPSPHGRPHAAPRLQHASRREAILAASTSLFRERSFTGVSLRDIGAAVGISASAVNRHFDSKEQLLATAFNRAAEQIAAGIAGAIGRSGSPAQAAVEIVRIYAHLAIECRDLIVINATETHFLPASYRDQRRRNQRMYVEELAQMLAAAHPELGMAECRIRAGSAFAAVNEVIMNDRLVQRPNLVQELTDLSLSLLQLECEVTAQHPS